MVQNILESWDFTIVTTYAGHVVDMVENAFNVIVSNPILMFGACAGMVGIGFRLFRKARRTAGA
jgi:hypothetical protein